MPKIDERLRMLIVGKMQDGSSLRKVSRELNICKTSVRNIWNKFRDTGSVVDKSRKGYKIIVSKCHKGTFFECTYTGRHNF